jgi:RHS repeat-associated protein
MVGYSNSDFNYNYSFNGMEKDNEAKGDGNQLFTLYRVYDTRLGRWLSVDPEEMSYPDVAPYISMDNNPNVNIDPEGDDWWDNVNGLARGSIDNVMGTDLRSSYKPNNYKTYNNSLRSVDAMFTVSSATLTYLGTNKIAAGTTGLISSGVVAGTGAGAPIGAAGAVGSGTLIGVGLLEVGTATVLMSHTSKNISKGYEYGKPKQKTTNSKQTAGNSQNETTTKGRGSNNRQPDTNAKGDHSTFNERGNTTYKQNPQNPSGFDEVKRTDVKGKPHTNKNGTKVATPHVHTKGEKDVIPAVKGKDY